MREAGDIGCADLGLQHARGPGHCLVQAHQPVTAQKMLDGEARDALAQRRPDFLLRLILRADADMAGFGGYQHAALATHQQCCRAETGSRPQHQPHAIRLGITLDQCREIAGLQHGERGRERLEIIDHQSLAQAERSRDPRAIEMPDRIGQLRLPPVERAGDGEHGRARLLLEISEHGSEGGLRRRIAARADPRERPVRALRIAYQREAAIGAADIGDQDRIGDRGRAHQSGFRQGANQPSPSSVPASGRYSQPTKPSYPRPSSSLNSVG